jgi:hypothetical protein
VCILKNQRAGGVAGSVLDDLFSASGTNLREAQGRVI